MCGPPVDPLKQTKEHDPYKGECRSCGASLENCVCWKRYEE